MKNTLRISTAFLFFMSIFSLNILYAQPSNDECLSAFHISDVSQFCSDIGQFTNVDATASPQVNPNCWPQNTVSNDVWFTFAPTALGAFIQLTGNTSAQVGSLVLPSLQVYTGNCTNLTDVACGSVQPNQENIVELTLTNLVIGQIYYLRVDGRNTNIGTFQICIDVFNPVPQPESDCAKAVVLCDKEPFFIENLTGVGDDTNEVNGTCIQTEFASVWYKWTCLDPGSLTFSLAPNNAPDDLDFAVYRLPGGIDDCGNKELLRCMASGETIGAPPAQNMPCMGVTGLSLGSSDTVENPGCASGDDNFVSAIDMVAGESYALVVNNFSQSGFGFSIEFGGTGTFLGPQADFEVEAVQAFECDKTIIFTNLSDSETDSIVSLEWNFGVGANPIFQSGEGPHDVVYESFGPKLAALTVESLRGCRVTKILDLFVEPCCADTSTLNIQATATDLICNNVPDGLIEAIGFNGSPTYNFSLDGNNFQPSSVFTNLDVGSYSVIIQDQKGCKDTTFVEINEPPPLTVDAGPDLESDLGFGVEIIADYFPNVTLSSIQWNPPDGLECDTCLTTLAMAPGTTAYVLTIVDEAGCIASDTVVVRVDLIRPIYAPTAISPNGDNINDFFNLFGGPAAEGLEFLYVYDRWGNLVYEGRGVVLGDQFAGWDGRFNGELVNPGVFAWVASVRFIDGITVDYSGDVTVIR